MVFAHGKRRRANLFARHPRYALYALNFFFSLHAALVSYYMSTFLVDRGFPQEFVGLVYATGSILALVSIATAPRLLREYGNYTNLLTLGLIELLAFVGFIFVQPLPLIVLLFLVTFVAPSLIVVSLDIFLEGASKDEDDTSGVRGLFLTTANVAWIAAPFLGGMLIGDNNFQAVFMASTFIFIPFIFLATSQLEHFKDPTYESLKPRVFMKTLTRDIDIRGIFAASFLLRFFYATMVIYFPLYLHHTLGMPLADLGLIIAIAITAFVLLEIPLGSLADKHYGEKEILILGFLILGISCGAFSFLATTSVATWAFVAFVSRIGAAMLEVGTEGYFFKQVDSADTDDVSAFRMLDPLAYIVSPLFGTAVLLVLPLQYLFIAVGAVLLLGILAIAPIHDTK